MLCNMVRFCPVIAGTIRPIVSVSDLATMHTEHRSCQAEKTLLPARNLSERDSDGTGVRRWDRAARAESDAREPRAVFREQLRQPRSSLSDRSKSTECPAFRMISRHVAVHAEHLPGQVIPGVLGGGLPHVPTLRSVPPPMSPVLVDPSLAWRSIGGDETSARQQTDSDGHDPLTTQRATVSLYA